MRSLPRHRAWLAGLALAAIVLSAWRAPRAAAADLGAVPPGPAAGSDFRTRSRAAFDGSGRRDGPLRRIGLDLAQLYYEHAGHASRGPAAGAFRSALAGLRIRDGRVVIDAIADGDAAALRDRLVALGLERPAVFGRYVSGWLPIAALREAAALPGLRLARPAFARVRSGVVTSQGDAVLGAATARMDFGVDGSGVTVGTLSDSFDCLGGAATDVANGDLPPGVAVLAETADCSAGTDEGRAMMQVIHDIAPGAALAFHAADGGTADFANGILALAAAGAGVIDDDLIYFAETMFQDGPAAQAVDQVNAMGVAYFSAAGNEARQSYEAPFRNSGQPGYFPGSVRHDFDPGPGVDTLQQITVAGNGTLYIVLQWDQPAFSVSGAPGSANDLDVILYNTLGFTLAGSAEANVGGDPVEVLVWTNSSTGPRQLQVGIELYAGAAPGLVKYVAFGDVTIDEYDTQSATSYGHPNAAGARAVGAVRYNHTPSYGVTPPLAEYFSSAGGVPILFDASGAPVYELRQKPEIMAIDGVDTSFFTTFDYEPNGFPNFFGTSAAVPHAAAVAALLRQFAPGTAPAGIHAALQDTALDMAGPGPDADTGYGLIQPGPALASLAPPSDADGDGVPDGSDNCILVPNGPLLPDAGGHSQLDADADGYGNACDGDFNNDGVTNAQDYVLFRMALGTAGGAADLNGNGAVNAQDYVLFQALLGSPPGPSGVAP